MLSSDKQTSNKSEHNVDGSMFDKPNKKENFMNLLTDGEKLLKIEQEMCTKLDMLIFRSPIVHIYNPLKYARNLHEAFVNKYFQNCTKKILYLGMNPGPWGMCQTGIAFGERNYVKEWFELSGSVEEPENQHPKKKVIGLDCHRSEISGKKFWGFFHKLCGTPENFFKHSFVHNHCCLAFMDASGKNITPPEIKDANTRKELYSICDEGLIRIVTEFNFETVIGIGKYAEKNAKTALTNHGVEHVKVFSIPHPSPRNVKNFCNWEQTTLMKLQEFNLLKYYCDEVGFKKDCTK